MLSRMPAKPWTGSEQARVASCHAPSVPRQRQRPVMRSASNSPFVPRATSRTSMPATATRLNSYWPTPPPSYSSVAQPWSSSRPFIACPPATLARTGGAANTQSSMSRYQQLSHGKKPSASGFWFHFPPPKPQPAQSLILAISGSPIAPDATSSRTSPTTGRYRSSRSHWHTRPDPRMACTVRSTSSAVWPSGGS